LKTLRSNLTAALCSLALLGLTSVALNAQTVAPPTFDNPYCGSMQNGTWVPTGNCNPVTNVGSFARVNGTIIAVRGHLVTLQQTDRTLVINDQPALDMETTGKVAVGRSIEASGYWRNGTFFATNLQ
jgi:hypothetical protein